MKISKIIILFIGLTTALANAQNNNELIRLFNSMDQDRGPNGRNIQQNTGNRYIVEQSDPIGDRIFEGAFRSNEIGRPLAKNFDFYLGNRYASNYFELMETYVHGVESNDYNNQSDFMTYGNKPRTMNNTVLISNGQQAMGRAASMARHSILEKYYVERLPESPLAASFIRYGAGDSADEQKYATSFFAFSLSAMETAPLSGENRDFQFLPLSLLIRKSPVGDPTQSASLERARELVRNCTNNRSTLLGRIRNAIHNQLSPTVLIMIEEFLNTRPRDGTCESRPFFKIVRDIEEVQKILTAFFSYNPSKSLELSRQIGLSNLERIASVISSDYQAGRASSLVNLLEYSKQAANLKSVIATSEISHKNKTRSLLLLTYVAQFLNSSLLNSRLYDARSLYSSDAALTILNSIYIEGFLTKRNWEYFANKISTAPTSKAAMDLLAQSTKISTDTLIKALAPSLEQWKLVESKMTGFVDDTIKSSAINTASVTIEKVREVQ